MNSLSWFLYFADVLPNLFFPFAFIFGALSLLFIGAGAIIRDGYPQDDCVKKSDLLWSHLKYLVPTFLVFLFLSLAMPSRETFYLIAGSELGETVVTSPEAKEIFNDIREVIRSQIKDKTNGK